MRYLVTGASGFLGSHLVARLLEHGHAVTVLLRPDSDAHRLAASLPYVRVLRGSLENLSGLRAGLLAEPVDAAFHLAWSGVMGEYRNDAELSIANVVGSLYLWKVLYETGCLQLIAAGSQAEYGPHPAALTEDLPTNPQTTYGASKLALGVLLRQLCASAGMRLAWVRVLSLYGPGDDDKHLVPRLIATLLRGERPPLTPGEQVWDYLHVDDAADAFRAVAETNAVGVFNLGSGNPVRLRDFIVAVRDAIDSNLPLGFGQVPYRPDQVMYLVADIGRISAVTGWRPRIGLQQGIQETIDWSQERRVHETRP